LATPSLSIPSSCTLGKLYFVGHNFGTWITGFQGICGVLKGTGHLKIKFQVSSFKYPQAARSQDYHLKSPLSPMVHSLSYFIMFCFLLVFFSSD
jgi:hypothetical protein